MRISDGLAAEIEAASRKRGISKSEVVRERLRHPSETEAEAVLGLMDKYADVPMSLADACLVRMSELVPDPLILSTDSDFRIYRRHGRKVIPCVPPE